MTKDIAIYNYFAEFSREYLENNKPAIMNQIDKDTILPYLEYESIDSDFEDGEVPINVKLWFRTKSETAPNAIARALRKYVEKNSVIRCDTGLIWIKPGTPFSTAMSDSEDEHIKLRDINLTIEYLTKEK